MASGSYLEAPSAGPMSINIRPNNSSLVIVGKFFKVYWAVKFCMTLW